MLQAELIVVGGKNNGNVIPLSKSKYIIGRGEDCDLRPSSELVSRHHCVFSVDDFFVRIRDLGSTNGTLVNGEQIRGEVQLSENDQVTVGKICLALKLSQSGDPKSQTSLPEITEAIRKSSDSGQLSSVFILPSSDDTSPVATAETSYEVPVVPEKETADSTQLAPPETPVANAPQTPQENIPAQQTSATVEATQQTQQFQIPPYPYPQQPMGYPQQPGYYPQPYPQQMAPGYPPQQMMPGQPMPPGQFPQQPAQQINGQPANIQPANTQPAPATPQTSDETDSSGSLPEFRLPKPTDTGAAPVEASKKKAAASGEDNPSNSAHDIIQQHRNRRPDIGENK